ncbi:hypothetical protein X801_08701 [Opisthorchis viverrini]|uniref:Uncharacterized protein n=1 Tax=Opisthorchis viverrini TaxID=6198 RepID=A0A1S8WM23_OPIVI|nr:hypothetical protein X801_08701 [Opisthorchis viverrini]
MLPFGVRRVVFIRLSMQWRRALVVAPKGALFEVSSYQEKTVTIDDYVGVAISGLTAHGRMLSRMMRRECAENRWAYDEPLPTSRLLSAISLIMQTLLNDTVTGPMVQGCW